MSRFAAPPLTTIIMASCVDQNVVDQAAREIQDSMVDDVDASDASDVSTISSNSACAIYLKKLLNERDNEIAFLKNQLTHEQSHNEENLQQAAAHMEKLKLDVDGWKHAFLKAMEELEEKNLRIEFVEEALAETSEKLEAKEKECKKIELVRDTIMSKTNGRVQNTEDTLQDVLARVTKLEEAQESVGDQGTVQSEFDRKIEDLTKEHATEMNDLMEEKNSEILNLKFEHQRKIREIIEIHEEKMGVLESLEKRLKKEEKNLEARAAQKRPTYYPSSPQYDPQQSSAYYLSSPPPQKKCSDCNETKHMFLGQCAKCRPAGAVKSPVPYHSPISPRSPAYCPSSPRSSPLQSPSSTASSSQPQTKSFVWPTSKFFPSSLPPRKKCTDCNETRDLVKGQCTKCRLAWSRFVNPN